MTVKIKNSLITRPPVVVILGHIDHGKTTLLDTIRKANVAAGEAGGITQHIGAYHIEHNGRTIAFIDTPGHEAFTKMRSRGATVADIGILVVAADDGVKPQTKEAIAILQETKLPFVVAFTKADKPEANVARAKQQLSENGVQIEEWGGKVPAHEVSGKTGQGVHELLDLIQLVADVEDLKGDTSVGATGVVIESHRDARQGNVATVLIKNGTMRYGEYIVAEQVMGKIKSMKDPSGRVIQEATFLTPGVIITGFDDVPSPGASFSVVPAKDEAQKIAQDAKHKIKKTNITGTQALSGIPVLKIILKVDKQGSVEAIEKSFEKIPQTKVCVEVLSVGIGDVSETDLKMAYSTGAPLFAFHVKIPPNMQLLAEQFGVVLYSFDIIYDLLEALEKEMVKLLQPTVERVSRGVLKILGIFKQSANSQVVGGKVVSGTLQKGSKVVITRSKKQIGEAVISQLQRNKVDVTEVSDGAECGILLNTKGEVPPIEIGDMLEAVDEKVTPASLT